MESFRKILDGELAVRLIKRKEHGTKTVRNAFPTNDVFHDQKVIFKESLTILILLFSQYIFLVLVIWLSLTLSKMCHNSPTGLTGVCDVMIECLRSILSTNKTFIHNIGTMILLFIYFTKQNFACDTSYVSVQNYVPPRWRLSTSASLFYHFTLEQSRHKKFPYIIFI